MKKKKGQYFILEINIFKFHIMVFIDETDEEIVKQVKTHYGNHNIDIILDMPKTTVGRCCSITDGVIGIRLKTYDGLIGTIAHEAFHSIVYILMERDVAFSIDYSDEVYAYLIEYITNEIVKKIKKGGVK